MHPKHKGLFIFNGLGTKGYMMAPLLSKEMAGFMLKGTPLHKEVEYARFIK
jgi:glycine/D-amino acid oxidase-like deaminating enzyme